MAWRICLFYKSDYNIIGAKRNNFLLGYIFLINYRLLATVISSQAIETSSYSNTYEYNKLLEKKATCDDRAIYFNLVFEKPFRGVVYSDGSYNVPRCVYVNGTKWPLFTHNVTIPMAACGSQVFTNGSKQNTIVVQQDPRILEVADHMYVISCQVSEKFEQEKSQATFGGGFDVENERRVKSHLSGTEGRRVTLTFSGVTVQPSVPLTELITNAVIPARGAGAKRPQLLPIGLRQPDLKINNNPSLDYAVEVQLGRSAPLGRKVDRALRVGEPLSYVVKLRNLHDADARIGRCWSSDRNGSEIQLSDDEGCTLQAGSSIWNDFKVFPRPIPDADKVLYNTIKTWAFPTSNRVHIFCNLHMCLKKCPKIACKPESKKRRNSRAIFGENQKVQISTHSLMFKTEGEYSVKMDQNQPFAEFLKIDEDKFNSTMINNRQEQSIDNFVCLTQSNFLIGLILLVIMIGLCLMFLFFIFLSTMARCRNRPLFYKTFHC